jgi:hypothetical protein
MKELTAVILCCAMAGVAGGCAGGKLTMDITAATELASQTYHLDDDGRLSVIGDTNVEGKPNVLHEATLDAAAMKTMRATVWNSRFLFALGPEGADFASGPALAADIKLGAWHNKLRTSGGNLPTLEPIVAELNRHLPAKLAIPRGTAERPVSPKNFEDNFRAR